MKISAKIESGRNHRIMQCVDTENYPKFDGSQT